jgi:hypothetical protein
MYARRGRIDVAYGYVMGEALVVYAEPAELEVPAAPWVRAAFEAMADGKADLSPQLERWAFPLGLRIGIERLLSHAGRALTLLTAEECEERAGAAGLNEHRRTP